MVQTLFLPFFYSFFKNPQGRHAVASQYKFKAQLVFLETFANPPPPKVSLRLETCMLTCQTIERQSLVGRIRGSSRIGQDTSPAASPTSRRGSTISQKSTDSTGRRKSLIQSMASFAESTVSNPEEYELSGKSGLSKPFCLLFADFADGAYRTGVMNQDENTGLPSTTDCPVMTPSSHSKVFLERQFLLFSVKNESAGSPAKADVKKADFYASAVLPLKNVLLSDDGRASFCIPLYFGGSLSGGTLTGIMRLSHSESTGISAMPQISSSTETVVESVYESERKTLTKPFGVEHLQAGKDPPAWANERGQPTPKSKFILQPGWNWQDDWRVHSTVGCDPDGWQYADNFKGTFVDKKKLSHRVRKRRWIRTRVVASKASVAV